MSPRRVPRKRSPEEQAELDQLMRPAPQPVWPMRTLAALPAPTRQRVIRAIHDAIAPARLTPSDPHNA